MTAQELGCRLHDDVRAVFERPTQERSGKGVVDHEGDAVPVRHLSDRFDVGDLARWVRDDLREDRLGVVIDFGFDGVGAVGIDEAGVDAQTPQGHVELSDRSAIERSVSDDVVARLRESRHG